MNAILLSKSTKPLLKIEVMINVFCFGILPIMVSTPDGDISDISSPILSPKEKLNSLPIDNEFFCNLDLFPLNSLLLMICNIENSLLS